MSIVHSQPAGHTIKSSQSPGENGKLGPEVARFEVVSQTLRREWGLGLSVPGIDGSCLETESVCDGVVFTERPSLSARKKFYTKSLGSRPD